MPQRSGGDHPAFSGWPSLSRITALNGELQQTALHRRSVDYDETMQRGDFSRSEELRLLVGSRT